MKREFPRIRPTGDLPMVATLVALRSITAKKETLTEEELKRKALAKCQAKYAVNQCIRIFIEDGVLVPEGDVLTVDWDRLDERIEIYNQTP